MVDLYTYSCQEQTFMNYSPGHIKMHEKMVNHREIPTMFVLQSVSIPLTGNILLSVLYMQSNFL
jgi:hypothetical protein